MIVCVSLSRLLERGALVQPEELGALSEGGDEGVGRG